MRENPELQKEIAKAGIDFSKCQMDKITRAYNSGQNVEFESFSPYLADYNLKTGEIWEDKLLNQDQIGLAVAKVLKHDFPKARMISLYDEYNTGLPETSDIYGRPTEGGKQLVLPDEVKENFRRNIIDLWKKEGIIGDEDREGNEYLMVSESSKQESAEKLVASLETKGLIQRNGEAIYYINPDAENQKYQEVQLRTKSGRWLCEALDASSYLDPKNLEINHLVVLPNEFKEQQDKVWEVLRSLGIKPDNYHNIFFDKSLPPEAVAEVVKEEIDKFSGRK